MVFYATFNNISVISWLSVLLVEETRVLGENHWPVASHWQTLSYNVVSSTPLHERFILQVWINSLNQREFFLYAEVFNLYGIVL